MNLQRTRSKRDYKGTVLANRGTLTLHAVDEDNRPVEIKYSKNTETALNALFNSNLYDLPPCFQPVSQLNPKNIVSKLRECAPTAASVVSYHRGRIKRVHINCDESKVSFPVHFLIKNHQLYLIKTLAPTNKCEFCGNYYKATHTCTTRRREFYFHHINTQSADWWEPIAFKPLGAPRETERLFVVYDVETYTWHGAFGKQLVPFMLVFKLCGEPSWVAFAQRLAVELHWAAWPSDPLTFYHVTPQKQAIGSKFKEFRNALQERVTQSVWRSVLEHNPALRDLPEVSPEALKDVKLQGPPKFIEIYVVGHNINGFDEIVLAAQIISNRAAIPPAFRISRNFMPRAGKILFNDIAYLLPNPSYAPRQDYAEWTQGHLDAADCKEQYVKFMVRDTFALTHTSLRNAAAAYALPVEKTHCPYRAVNEFYMLGTYRSDDDGFPALEYWKDEDEYRSNKQAWEEKKNGPYDIVQETLRYCVIDVQVTAELVQKLRESYRAFVADAMNLPACSFNVFQRPTISSNSHAMFKQVLYRAHPPEKPNLADILLAPSNEMYAYVRESIRGGRCYPTYVGVLASPIYVYDICGMYASALTHPFPSGRPLNPFERAVAVRTYERKMETLRVISYFDPELLPGIFTVDADPPDDTQLDVLPPFCSRKGGRLCWTNEALRGEVATSIDVITLHNRGWRVRIVPDERTTVFPEWRCLAKDYVQLNIAAKEKADKSKNQTMRSIAKLLSNALYGSFATKLDNKKIVFADQIEESDKKHIADGSMQIKSSSYIETDNLCAEIMPELVVVYPPAPELAKHSDSDADDQAPPFIGNADHVTYTFKPITFLDAEEEDFCLHTVEKATPLIKNNKYPSQIASFVLAWTRAFVSEWAGFLYDDDKKSQIPLHLRTLKSVYGDTDSLFVTEEGHRLMEAKGKHRLKKYGGPLVFDPKQPQLTWQVECETQCALCKADAFSSECVFLAPKLYALRDVTCPQCAHVGKGKLRAKGHATTELSYDLLTACYYSHSQLGDDRFQTSRLSLKRTLASAQSHVHPFTVTETTLTRTLRPWKDKTLHQLDQHRLIPYSNANPNPRNQELTWMEMTWDT
uniref:DNA polymerase n=2 Tax=Adenoviridae TaxID=10508 RepID=A0AAU7E1P2_9ADEN